jgi:hypothetical protein
MTEYHVPYTTVLSQEVQERKKARRKLLEMIWQRRRERYIHFMRKKRRLQAEQNTNTYE